MYFLFVNIMESYESSHTSSFFHSLDISTFSNQHILYNYLFLCTCIFANANRLAYLIFYSYLMSGA